MSVVDGDTPSRPNQAAVADRCDAAQPPAGSTRRPAPARGPHWRQGQIAREPARASRVDWTLALRRRLDRSGASASEIDALAASVSRVVAIEADREIVREDDVPAECRLLLDGWTCRYIPLETARPQILGLQLPGDFLDLQGLLRRRMDHVIASLTPCRIGVIPHDALRRLTARHPRIARMLQLETAFELATTRRWLLNAGHRQAYAGMAHLICELFTRAAAAGLTEASRFSMLLTRAEFGSALGLTAVHVNRTVKRLHWAGLVTWRGRWMTIEDWDGLTAVADFDPAYLKR